MYIVSVVFMSSYVSATLTSLKLDEQEGHSVSTPSVLVVLPTLGDRQEFLERALQSCSDLHARIPTTVAVVVSPDSGLARQAARDAGAVVVDDPGTGMAEAVNAGLRVRSTEEFYVWLGDDDELVPSGVVELVGALAQDASAVMAYGHCDYVDGGGSVIGTSKAGPWARFLLPWGPNLIPHPGTVVRLSALQGIGGFDPALRYALDLDVFLRLRTVGRAIFRPVLSARFRWHPESATVADRAASSREAMAVKSRHLPRWLQPLSGLWNVPVAWASLLAAWLVTVRARRLGS
jgi:GT2 family glycosyltransferase